MLQAERPQGEERVARVPVGEVEPREALQRLLRHGRPARVRARVDDHVARDEHPRPAVHAVVAPARLVALREVRLPDDPEQPLAHRLQQPRDAVEDAQERVLPDPGRPRLHADGYAVEVEVRRRAGDDGVRVAAPVHHARHLRAHGLPAARAVPRAADVPAHVRLDGAGHDDVALLVRLERGVLERTVAVRARLRVGDGDGLLGLAEPLPPVPRVPVPRAAAPALALLIRLRLRGRRLHEPLPGWGVLPEGLLQGRPAHLAEGLAQPRVLGLRALAPLPPHVALAHDGHVLLALTLRHRGPSTPARGRARPRRGAAPAPCRSRWRRAARPRAPGGRTARAASRSP